jgi:AcrR family transcriptional regulator
MPPRARKPTTTRGPRKTPSGDTSTPTRVKPDQRERLVEAMIELCAKSGYQAVSIAQVSSQAGVSSATFYDQFEDKEDLLLAAYEVARKRILGDASPTDCPERWPEAARLSLSNLSASLQDDPDGGRLVFVEALAGEARIRNHREEILAEYETAASEYLDAQPGNGTTLDLPVSAIEGARRYIISRHLRTHSVDLLPKIVEDLIVWLHGYEVPAGASLWSSSSEATLSLAAARRCAPVPAAALVVPPPLPRGRHKLPPAMVARSRRARILAGTAEVMLAKGYANASVTDIVAAAGIARDVFYEHFDNKQHAFLETQQSVTQAVLELCGSAYFKGKDWPERVWLLLCALCGLIAGFPALAHVRIVECYAAGPIAVRGTEELLRTVALFLEEGYSYRQGSEQLPRTASLAIAGAIFELIYRLVAKGEAEAVPRYLPLLGYIAIAPFTSTADAVGLIREYTQKA